MTFPIHPIAVLCDIDEACKLFKELREAGIRCLSKEEVNFREVFRDYSCIGLLWGSSEIIIPLMNRNAAAVVSMPEFRAAFGLPTKPQPTP